MFSKEYILCAAIHCKTGNKEQHQPKNISRGIVICGRRHHNCILTKSLMDLLILPPLTPHTQGFITSKDRFVDRKEAGQIAFTAGQIPKPLVNKAGKQIVLVSEDLY